MIPAYHLSPADHHVNTLPPHTYFIPFDRERAADREREESPFFTSLDGDWRFLYLEDTPTDCVPDIPTESFGAIKVPACWQMFPELGTDRPQYINQDYPFPVDPPDLPDTIPCGVYEREFGLKVRQGKRYVLVFEGAAPCAYVWINGRFAAFFSVSHAANEIDITPYVKDGGNTVRAVMPKYCVGSYMEDQDFFRLSGLFRSVYILERDENGIEDIDIKTALADDLKSAVVRVETAGGEPEIKLFSPDGAEIPGKDGVFRVDDPQLWSAEDPVLYRAVIHSGSEYISLDAGIRKTEVKDGTLLFNGAKVKLRGVNRHDTDPETGFYVTPEQMEKDVILLKRGNVNTVRTSHYPNDPRFVRLCDRYGIMLIDECDLEAHGMGYNFGDWRWDYWSHMCDDPLYLDMCLDRVKRLYERDKCAPSVIMFSLGNESGCGESHRAMAEYVRSRDPAALIHYENARLEYQERVGRDFTDISDVESRMYASIEYAEEFLASPSRTKPFFYCEYLDGSSIGNIHEYWERLGDDDGFAGACVWQWRNHAVNAGTKEKPRYLYGRDFGVYPADELGCLNGITTPDGRPMPHYYEMKACYCPYDAVPDNGAVLIKNRQFFTGMAGVETRWELFADGRTAAEGVFDTADVPAGGSKRFPLPEGTSPGASLIVRFIAARPTAYCEKGFEFGARLIETESEKPAGKTPGPEPAGSQNGSPAFVFTPKRGLTAIDTGGKKADVRFNIMRAATHGTEEWLYDEWERARFPHTAPRCVSPFTAAGDGVISGSLRLAAPGINPLMDMDVAYAPITGGYRMTCRCRVDGGAPPLPRFGILIGLPEEFGSVRYTGMGPHECYPDRFRCAVPGTYETTAKDNYFRYVRPQESGAHIGVTAASVSTPDGRRLTLSSPAGFVFNAIPYAPEDIINARHDFDLPDTGKTYVYADYRIDAPGGATEETARKLRFGEKEFEFVIDLRFENGGQDG